MTKLNQLTDEGFQRKKRKRVGRGIGSGTGKTCGAGHKGQKSRSGVSINGFEGGQNPIYRRLPKRGFVNIARVEFATLNLGQIQKLIETKVLDAKKDITVAALVAAKLVKKNALVKILGSGEIKDAVTFQVHAASASAIKAVEKASGKVVLVEIKKPEDAADKADKKAKKSK